MVLQAVIEFPVFHPIGVGKLEIPTHQLLGRVIKQINIVGSNYSHLTEINRMVIHSQ